METAGANAPLRIGFNPSNHAADPGVQTPSTNAPLTRDVFSSQRAVEFARQRLRLHNDPTRCAEELVAEALRMVGSRGGGEERGPAPRAQHAGRSLAGRSARPTDGPMHTCPARPTPQHSSDNLTVLVICLGEDPPQQRWAVCTGFGFGRSLGLWGGGPRGRQAGRVRTGAPSHRRVPTLAGVGVMLA